MEKSCILTEEVPRLNRKEGRTGTIPIRPNDAVYLISCAMKCVFVVLALYSDALSVYK